jgi:hypothetical protein
MKSKQTSNLSLFISHLSLIPKAITKVGNL